MPGSARIRMTVRTLLLHIFLLKMLLLLAPMIACRHCLLATLFVLETECRPSGSILLLVLQSHARILLASANRLLLLTM